jgi:hypothetical protein
MALDDGYERGSFARVRSGDLGYNGPQKEWQCVRANVLEMRVSF